MFLPDGEFEEELRVEEWLTGEPEVEFLELGVELFKPGVELALDEKLLSFREGMELDEDERNEEEGEEDFDLKDEDGPILSE